METPLLAAARARGVPCANGLGMLVHQAALAFELWTGVDAPLDGCARRRAARTRHPRSRRDHVLVAACSIVGLVAWVGWLLDPVITRVPLQQPVSRPARPRRASAARSAAVRSSRSCRGALFGALAARYDDTWALPGVPRAHRRARRARGHRPRALPPARTGSSTRSRSRCVVLLTLAAVGDDNCDAIRPRPARRRDRVRDLLPAPHGVAAQHGLRRREARRSSSASSLGWLGWGEVFARVVPRVPLRRVRSASC